MCIRDSISLFIATLLLLVPLSVPYLSLVSIQWLLKVSHYRIRLWVQRLKPLLDAYTEPYRANHCYWTGLLLLVQIVLFIIFSSNQTNNSTINLLVIMIFSSLLQVWLYFTRGVYKSLLNNCLEIVFLGNLGLTSTVMLFEVSNSTHTPAVMFISTGITLIIFIGIIFYHTQRELFLTRAGAKLKRTFLRSKGNKEVEGVPAAITSDKAGLPKGVTYSVVELIQPLLERKNY